MSAPRYTPPSAPDVLRADAAALVAQADRLGERATELRSQLADVEDETAGLRAAADAYLAAAALLETAARA